MRGIFYNSPKSQCSIYESGLMIYNALKLSSMYTIDYTEEKVMLHDYDFAIFNYHPYVNSWITKSELDKYKGQTFGIVLEVGHHVDLMPNTAKIFQKYIVIDPTITDTHNIFGFPRPIERYPRKTEYPPEVTIGSFGFATQGKRWAEVLEQTNKTFDNATIKINIPYATFVPNCHNEINKIREHLLSIKLKPYVKLKLTHDYLDKTELIDWCAENTANCFPYYRDLAGLAAVTDQAISAQKPILITNNPAFRHLLKYIEPYTEIGFKEAMIKSITGVYQMYNDWSPITFCQKFERIL